MPLRSLAVVLLFGVFALGCGSKSGGGGGGVSQPSGASPPPTTEQPAQANPNPPTPVPPPTTPSPTPFPSAPPPTPVPPPAAGTEPPPPPPTTEPPPPTTEPPPPQPPPGPGPAAVDDSQLRAALAQRRIGPATPPARPSDELVALGRALFFDKLLSGSRDVSCATCHHPQANTCDGLPLSLGVGAAGTATARRRTGPGQLTGRNSPPVFQLAAQGVDAAFWDGRVSRNATTGALTTPEPVLNGRSPQRPDLAGPLDSALAAQAMFPVTNPVEMRGTTADPTNELAGGLDNPTIWARLMARLVGTNEGTTGGVEEYRTMFRAAFPQVARLDDLTFGHAAKAIASFERTLAFNDQSPLDAYVRGDSTALSEAAKRGGLLFTGAARCSACHTGPLLADTAFHVVATPQVGPGEGGEPNDDRGRALITGNRNDDYEFRTPTLRNVALTAPYMHAGAYSNLPTVVDHYRDPTNHLLFYDAGRNLPPEFQGDYRQDFTKDQARLARLSPVIGNGVALTLDELPDVVAFLEALTDPRARQLQAPGSVPSGLPVGD